MSFYIKNLTGAPIDIDDLGLQLEAGSAGSQTVDLGGLKAGGDPTGLTNDGTIYTATITVDGNAVPITVTGSTAQTFTALLTEINSDLTNAGFGGVVTLPGDLVVTSGTTGSGSISIADTDLFSSLTGYVAIDAAVAGTGIRDMLYEEAGDVQASARLGGDLEGFISGGDIIVLDPKDGATPLTIPKSLQVAEIHNDPNWGINGGELNDLDDVDTSGASPGDVLQLNGGGTSFTSVTPATLAGDIELGDLSNVTDGSTPTASDIFILKGTAGGEFTVADGLTDTVLLDHIEDSAGELIANSGTLGDLTFTYNAGTNTFDASVDDSYLRNDGDTLDSGTLTVASGASVAVLTGGTITWVDAPTSPNELANKAYVDSIAAGSTWKDPIVDVDLVEITATNPGTMAAIAAAYGLTTGDNVAFISSAAITFDAGGTTVVGTGAGDIVNLTMVSGTVGDYSIIETPLSVGDRFIIAGEHGTIGTVLGAFDVNSDGALLADADLIEYIGGTVTSASSWSTPEGRSGQSTGTPELAQGTTVLVSDPDSVHYGHTYLYDQTANAWLEIAGPSAVGAGTGLSYTGNTLNVNMGAGIAELPSDEVGIDLYDAATGAIILTTDGSTRTSTTGTQLHLLLDGTTLTQGASGLKVDSQGITETELHASVAGLGIAGGNGTALSLDPSELTDTPTVGGDVLVLGDASASEAPIKRSVTDFLADHDIVSGVTGTGIIVQTAADTYVARSIDPSVVAGDQGISIVNGDGVAGNPTIGVDVLGLAASGDDLIASDLFLMYDGSNNVKLTGQQLADGVATILGGLGVAYTTINGDTGSAVADTSSDTLNLVGAVNGGIVTVASDASTPDSVTFALDIEDLTLGTGPLVIGDEFAVSDGGSTLKFSFQDLVDDLDIPYNITGDGFVVRTADNTFDSRAITVSGVGQLDGLAVTNGDGIAGNPVIGLDIDNNALAGEDMVADDKFIGFNTSETANEAFTGQEVADGVASILGLSNIAVTTVNASVGTQDVLTLVDTTRSNKNLSVGDTSVNWSENNVGNNDWLNIGGAVDAKSGYIVPLDATIVKVTAHTANAKGNTKPINLYVNGVLDSTVATLAGAGEQQFEDVTTDIDLSAGDKLSLRGGTGGKIEDTVVTLWIKWRG